MSVHPAGVLRCKIKIDVMPARSVVPEVTILGARDEKEQLSLKSTMISKPPKHQRKWTSLALEPRLMLAADAGVAVEASTAVCDSQWTQIDVAIPAGTPQQISSEKIVFVDDSLQNLDEVVSGIEADAHIVLLDPAQSFAGQISSQLSKHHDVAEVHIITHGEAGALHLGEQVIDISALRRNAMSIIDWSEHLAPGADILLYGCDVTSDQTGRQFVSLLADLTGADVAASSNRTGNATDGGNWILETHVGDVQSELALTWRGQRQFSGTLNVTVNASGSTGEEIMQLLINDTVRAQWTVGTENQSFVFETDEVIAANNIKIRFINDLYQPDQGIDRNLKVDSIELNREVFQTAVAQTYSTGTWTQADGVTPGFARGDTLHANGILQYQAKDVPSGVVTFEDLVFNKSEGIDDLRVSGTLNASTTTEGVIWASTAIEPGQNYRLLVDGEVAGFGSSGPFVPLDGNVTIGVDFYDENGIEVGEGFTSLAKPGTFDTPTPNFKSFDVTSPDNAKFANIWVHIEANSDSLTRAEISQISFDPVANLDDQQPQATLVQDGTTITDSRNAYLIDVQYTDDIAISEYGQIQLTKPDGSTEELRLSTVKVDAPNNQTGRYSFFSPSFMPGPEINGTYTVTLLDNTARDSSGKTVPGGVVGTFQIEIPDSDTVAPTVSLGLSELQVAEDGTTEIFVSLEDNFSNGVIRNPAVQEQIRVVGPNGSSRTIAADRNIGIPPRTADIFVLRPDPGQALILGQYTVELIDRAYQDSSGNQTSAQTIGTFNLIA